MSLGFGLGAGLRALTAARLGMQTAGNNVANANTPGYSRQRVELSAAMPMTLARGMQIGMGVDVSSITRLVDDGLERRLRMQQGLVAGAQVDMSRMSELENMLAEPNGGLSTGLSDLFGALGRLQTDPSERSLRGGVVQSANTLAQNFNLLSGRLDELAGGTFDEVRGLVTQANQLASNVADLNAQIVAIEANGTQANDLRDTRAEQVRQLSELVDVSALERGAGSLDLLVGGRLLVAGSRASTLAVGKTTGGATQVLVNGTTTAIEPRQGRIAALLRSEQTGLTGYSSRIDQMARSLILETNRRHSTGMPASGPYQSLTSTVMPQDGDGDGVRGDELLSQSGLPFDVQNGSLYVSMTDRATGRMTRTRIDIDPTQLNLTDVAWRLDQIDNLSASVDTTGKLRIAADSGYGVDFSPRLDPNPAVAGTFGGAAPSMSSSGAGPYDLSTQTFPVTFVVQNGTTASPRSTNVTLDATDFANPAAASTDELVAAINADLGGNATASNVNGRLVITSTSSGADAQLAFNDMAGGTAVSALGLPTTVAMGQSSAVDVRVSGAYTGSENDQYSFYAVGDGQVGVTAGLMVSVYDRAGALVATLDVGDSYEPGTDLEVGNGVKVSFGPGRIQSSTGQAFALDTLADSDTSDILVALGINSFFQGSGAADIAVNPELRANVDALAAGIGSAEGDAGNLIRLLDLREAEVDDLDANTIEDFWADVIGDVGFETAGAEDTLSAQDLLLQRLEAERESVSGVNLDEEMLDMVRFQQSFDAAARFLSTVQELTDTLINLGR